MSVSRRRTLASSTARPRLSTTARGYGASHVKERKRWAPLVETGQCTCARCGRQIFAGQSWDLDHDPSRSGYLGPSHAACNRAAGGRTSQALRFKAHTPHHSRHW